MRRTNTAFNAHIIWSTWDRLPLLTGEMKMKAYASILSDCRWLRTDVLVIGGIEDHVHLLVCTPASLAPADLVNQVKGASSHLINQTLPGDDLFKWQGSYWARSVSPEDLPRVRRYIERQEEHHRAGTTDPRLEDDVEAA